MIMTSAVAARIHAVAPVSKAISVHLNLCNLHAGDLMNVTVLFLESCRMKSPVVPFYDPAAATQQLAKFSLEGSYIPILINISIMKKNLPSEPRRIWRKENLKKAGAHR
jgi:hypothetical protein